MQISETSLPQNSFLKKDKLPYDFVDSFMGEFSDEKNSITSADVGKAFFTSAPEWVGHLFELRNKIVRHLGLKTSGNTVDRETLLANFHCEPGEQLGLFKVFYRDENEVILGEDDQHLNFRVSLYMQKTMQNNGKKQLVISTAVQFHNIFGKIYFLPVKPFHKLIVPRMLKGILQKLEQEN